MTKVIAILAVLGGNGCSFIGVSGPSQPVHGTVTCNSYLAPIVDSVVTAIGVLAIAAGGTYLAVAPPYDNGGDGQGINPGGLLIFSGIVLGLPYVLSAKYGYSKVSGCNAVAEDMASLARAESLTNAAVIAASAGDCATVRQIGARLQKLDTHLHKMLFHDPTITQCLASVDAPYCFADTTDGKVTKACMPTEAECQHAIEMLSLGSESTCVATAPAD